MEVRENRLEASGIRFERTPNASNEPFAEGLPDTIVLHYTAGASAESSVRTLTNPRSKASAHLVVGRDGELYQLLEFHRKAWHAGRSLWKDRQGLNSYSIGIEIDNPGRLQKSGQNFTTWFGRKVAPEDVLEARHRNEDVSAFWHTYTERQIDLVQEICATLIETYGITEILGHEEIAPGRKSDPGPAFPLDTLRQRLLGTHRDENGAPEEPEMRDGKRMGIVQATKLNIRNLPQLGAALVREPLTRGTEVEILQEQGEWLRVRLATEGWVSKNWIRG